MRRRSRTGAALHLRLAKRPSQSWPDLSILYVAIPRARALGEHRVNGIGQMEILATRSSDRASWEYDRWKKVS